MLDGSVTSQIDAVLSFDEQLIRRYTINSDTLEVEENGGKYDFLGQKTVFFQCFVNIVILETTKVRVD